MLVLLIVVPAVIVAVGVVAVLDWLGVLPRLDTGTASAPGSFLERLPRAGLYGAAGVMAAWIVAWVVLFVVGISTLSG